jgi:hypothetical protein
MAEQLDSTFVLPTVDKLDGQSGTLLKRKEQRSGHICTYGGKQIH